MKIAKIDETDEKIIKLLEQDLSHPQIANELGITKQAVNRRVHKIERIMQITLTKPKWYTQDSITEKDEQIIQLLNQGLTQPEISTKLGISMHLIQKRMKLIESIRGEKLPRNYRKVKLDENRLIDLLENGFTQRQIAKEMGVSQNKISKTIREIEENQGINLPRYNSQTKLKSQIDETDKKIIELLNQGLIQSKVARELNLSSQAVANRIKKIERIQKISLPNNKWTNQSFITENDEQIIQLLNQGLSQPQVANKFGVSINTIIKRIKLIESIRDIKLPRNYNRIVLDDNKIIELLTQGFSITKIAEEMGVSSHTISKRIRELENLLGIKLSKPHNKPKKTPKRKIIDNNEIINLINQGLTQAEIASQLGVSRKTINIKIKQLEESNGIDLPRGYKKRKNNDVNNDKLIETIMQLKHTKNATDEQLKTIANLYGVDISEFLSNTQDEPEK